MSIAWQEFVRLQISASHELGGAYFNYPLSELESARDGLVMCDLSQYATIRVSGQDAQNFLQNMLSSDVREASPQHAQISSLNSPKGRVLASLLVWCRQDDYYLYLPHNLCMVILKRLSMYVLRAKVKIEDVSRQQVILGLSGVGSEALVQQAFGSVPQAIWAVEQHDQASVIRCDAQRFLINIPEQYAPAFWQKLVVNARPVASTCWDWLNIRAGIPVILPVTQDQFVPQMVNLDLIGGVSFKKGCYPGQEIVARMQYLGKLKRRMYLAHIPKNQVEGRVMPQPGDALCSADMVDQSCGMLVNVARAPSGGCDLLAVVQNSSCETQQVHLQSLQGAVLQFLPLPYLFQNSR